MDLRRRLLWVDGSAGWVVGVVVLLIHGWLGAWYGLPSQLLFWMALANMTYGTYSLSLASRSMRPMVLILFLVAANLTWAAVCVILAISYRESATWLGIGHLMGEGLFVSGLAALEWRWRELLRIQG